MAWLTLGCSAFKAPDSAFVLVPPGPTPVHLGESLQLTSTRPGAIFTVIGGEEFGSIDAFGLYTAPDTLPEASTVTILAQDDSDDSFALIELVP